MQAETMLISEGVQWVAGGAFGVWMISNFVTIALKIKNNGNGGKPSNLASQVHVTETHDTLAGVGRIESTLKVMEKEAPKQTAYLKKIAENKRRE